MRKGFSLVTAIMFMVVIAIVGSMTLNTSTLTVKQTQYSYLKEQANLLLRGATERAVYQIITNQVALNNHHGTCADTSSDPIVSETFRAPRADGSGQEDVFRIQVRVVKIIGKFGTCGENVTSPALKGTVILNAVVESSDAITRAVGPIRYSRQTIQKL